MVRGANLQEFVEPGEHVDTPFVGRQLAAGVDQQ